MRRVLVAALSLAILAAAPALANHTTQQDPRDVHGRLDVAEIRFDHSPGLRWELLTYRGWKLDQLWDRGYLLVRLDTRGDDDSDYLAMVRSDGEDLVAELYRVRKDGAQVSAGSLETRKQSQRLAWVEVPLNAISIGKGRTSYFWSATNRVRLLGLPSDVFGPRPRPRPGRAGTADAFAEPEPQPESEPEPESEPDGRAAGTALAEVV